MEKQYPPSTDNSPEKLFIQALLTYQPILGLVFSIGLVVIYYVTREWQYLAAAASILVYIAIWIIAGLLFRRGKLNTFRGLTILAIAALLPTFVLVWSGITITIMAIIATWGLIWGYIIFSGFRRTSGTFAIIVCTISTIAIILISYLEPINRIDVSDSKSLRLLLPLAVIVLGSFLLLLITRTSITKRLYTRTILAFLLVVLIPIITISTITTIGSLDTDRQYAVKSLTTAATLKSDQITLWASQIQVDVFSIPHDPATEGQIKRLLDPNNEQAPAGNEADQLTRRFNEVLEQTGRVKEIFLLDTTGKVVVATEPSRLNIAYPDRSFFTEGMSGLWISEPLYQEDLDEVAIFISRPILNNRGGTIGVLAARADLRDISKIVANRSGLGESGRATLISSDGYFLNGIISGSPTKKIDTLGASTVLLDHEQGSLEYLAIDGTPVVGVFQWLPDLNIAIITEISRAEAFQNAQSVLRTNILIGVLGAAFAIIGAAVTTRMISAPVLQLVTAAEQVAAGNLDVKVEVTQQDEIGVLGNTLNKMTTQLKDIVANLEERIDLRTRDLERRTIEMRTAAQVAREASIATDMENLLGRTARLIRERFGFYHSGVFLIDDHGEYAVLSAAGGEAGQLMLANHHKLRVGEVGIVGFVASTGQARVALDTGADAVYFRNPLLPYTRSEMALPLKVGEKVLGVLDVQSEKSNAFDQEDIDTLQVMADQIAVAIERTKLLQDYDQAIARLESSSRSYSSVVWKEFIKRSLDVRGYIYRGTELETISDPPAISALALERGETVTNPDPMKEQTELSVPITLRGQAIGTLNFRIQGKLVPKQTIALAEEAASRLALALENARLVQDAQRLAAREKQVNVIAAQVQKSTDMESILQNAVRELGNSLGLPEVFIQLGRPKKDQSQEIESN